MRPAADMTCDCCVGYVPRGSIVANFKITTRKLDETYKFYWRLGKYRFPTLWPPRNTVPAEPDDRENVLHEHNRKLSVVCDLRLHTIFHTIEQTEQENRTWVIARNLSRFLFCASLLYPAQAQWHTMKKNRIMLYCCIERLHENICSSCSEYSRFSITIRKAWSLPSVPACKMVWDI